MNKDFLSLQDLSDYELIEVLNLADTFKQNRTVSTSLANKSIGLIFLKSSTRTLSSFQVGIGELAGQAIYLDKDNLQISRGETLEDTAKTLSLYFHGLVIRGHEHSFIEDFAKSCSIPVINALTNSFHPCQLLADLMLIRNYNKDLNVKVAFVGDCNSNMAHSWAIASKKTNIELSLVGSSLYAPDNALLEQYQAHNSYTFHTDIAEGVKDADFIYTDVWVSMGFEEEKQTRIENFMPYQVNKELTQYAKKDAKIMHCLPAYKGYEISQDVLEGKNSVIWEQAENRLHAQKALMAMLF